VRQSHPQQVIDHVESTARQYALVERATAWGWALGHQANGFRVRQPLIHVS
jgi:hypothetical protein